MEVSYHPEFSEDITAAAIYLEDQQAGLGDRFLDTVESVCRDVVKAPLLNSYIDKPVRRKLVKPFSYAVHYELINERQLYIYGCYHCAWNPKVWAERRNKDD